LIKTAADIVFAAVCVIADFYKKRNVGKGFIPFRKGDGFYYAPCVINDICEAERDKPFPYNTF